MDGLKGSTMSNAKGKPSWGDHNWPQIFQNEVGNWFGAREGWSMSIAKDFKGDAVWLLREDGEFLSFGDYSGDWRDSLEARPK